MLAAAKWGGWILWHTHSGQTHLRLANAAILPCRSCTDPVTQWPGRGEAQHGTSEDGEVHESNALAVEVVGRVCEVLTLRKVDCQERRAAPGNDEGSKFDDRECEELPWDPEVECDGPERVRAHLPELPLLLTWRAFAEMRVAVCRCLVAKVGHSAVRWDLSNGCAAVLRLFDSFYALMCCVNLFSGIGWGCFLLVFELLYNLVGVKAVP